MADVKLGFKLTRSGPKAPGVNGVVRLIGDLLERGATKGLEHTKEQWPTGGTGRSKAAFRIERDGLHTVIRNHVRYSGFVRRKNAPAEERARGIDETLLVDNVRRELREELAKNGERSAAAFLAQAIAAVERGN